MSARRSERRRRAAGAVLACAAVLLAGTACTARRVRPADGPEVTLAFAGDVQFLGRTGKLLDDPRTAVGPMAAMLSSADLAFVNLESAVTTRGTPEPVPYLFRTDPRAVTALRAAGIDAVTLANNHTMDYGRVGLADTLAALRAGGVGAFGAGNNADEAFAPWRATVHGVRVAVLGISQVTERAEDWAARDGRSGIAMAFDERRALAAVSAARGDSDLVVVFVHWGTEGEQCPSRAQRYFARRLASAGADIVVGAHVHVLQPDGWLGGTYVDFGMGNFVWRDSGLVPEAVDTGLLKLTVRGRTVVQHTLVPAFLSATGQPVQMTGLAADRQLKHLADLRACSRLAAAPDDL